MQLENALPGTEDLLAKLNFDPSNGRIWFDKQRMFLIDAYAFGTLRRDMIESIGFRAARELMQRFGYISGAQDARLAREIRKGKGPLEQFLTGPQLHAIKGFIWSEHAEGNIPDASEFENSEVSWIDSAEADIHIQAFGIGSSPACWMEVGYSEGFMSTLYGRKIEVREVKCRAMGHDHCQAVAKPAEDWEPRSKRSKTARKVKKSLPAVTSAVGSSSVFNTVINRIQRVAPTSASVLLLGESGVGKTLLAKEIHSQSPRSNKPFIEVNCAAIPEQLMEAEMFGVEKGAYTGAQVTRSGRFEAANEGTIFLDEISLLPLTAQSKLLRILQTGEMEYLGSNKTRKVNVRVIAATNDNLETLIKEGKFREDLYFRLNVFPIHIPPLRKRLDDLPDLVEMCLKKFSDRHDKRISHITPQAFEDIINYDWPGNIRELENVIERGVILADDEEAIDNHHLFTNKIADEDSWEMHSDEQPLRMLNNNSYGKSSSMDSVTEAIAPSLDYGSLAAQLESMNLSIEELNNGIANEAVIAAKGNLTKAAQKIGMSRSQLSYKKKKGLI